MAGITSSVKIVPSAMPATMVMPMEFRAAAPDHAVAAALTQVAGWQATLCGLGELFNTLHANFLECFKAVRDESRTHDLDFFDAFLAKPLKLIICVWSQPGISQ